MHVVVQPVREYLDGPLNAHVIGYTGPASPEQYQRLKGDAKVEDLGSYLDRKQSGDTVQLGVLRDGQSQTIDVVLGE